MAYLDGGIWYIQVITGYKGELIIAGLKPGDYYEKPNSLAANSTITRQLQQ